MLVIQDDRYSGSLHLDEVILTSVSSAVAGGGAFAFVSQDGLSAIFDSDEFRTYLKHYRFHLIIGVDAITNRKALNKAKQLVQESKGSLRVQVYYDGSRPGLFHPKFTWFKDEHAEKSVSVVGSGNLTISGLQNNIEAYSWTELSSKNITEVVQTWDSWISESENAGRLYEVDDQAVLLLAEQNEKIALKRKGKPAAAEEAIPAQDNAVEIDQDVWSFDDTGEVFIGIMPKQTGRGWSQMNIPKSIFEDYFGFRVDERDRRVLLKEIGLDGSEGDVEDRPGGKTTSTNFRIELAAGKGIELDAENGYPIVVFVKTSGRTFLYSYILPEDKIYTQLVDFTEKRKNLHGSNLKCLTNINDLKSVFSDFPLITKAYFADISQ